jgi:hypothetical protein
MTLYRHIELVTKMAKPNELYLALVVDSADDGEEVYMVLEAIIAKRLFI